MSYNWRPSGQKIDYGVRGCQLIHPGIPAENIHSQIFDQESPRETLKVPMEQPKLRLVKVAFLEPMFSHSLDLRVVCLPVLRGDLCYWRCCLPHPEPACHANTLFRGLFLLDHMGGELGKPQWARMNVSNLEHHFTHTTRLVYTSIPQTSKEA